jgi:hypothetical protein
MERCARIFSLSLSYDGYAGADALRSTLGYDNTLFLQSLRDAGFYVFGKSRSAYSLTLHSVSSTLNMNYIQDDLPVRRDAGPDFRPLWGHFMRPRVTEFLGDNGYGLRSISTAFDIDTERNPRNNDIMARSSYERMAKVHLTHMPFIPLLEMTLGPDRKILNPYRDHCDDLNGKFAELETALRAKTEKPMFTYAHFLMPHPPMVFDADGNCRKDLGMLPLRHIDGAYATLGHFWPGGWAHDYTQGYVNAVRHANAELKKHLLTAVQAGNGRPRIIFLMGDHGGRMHANFGTDHPDLGSDIYNNLEAVFYSDGDYSTLNDSMSPINVMRATMNKYFETGLPMVPQRQFFVDDTFAWRPIEVTSKLPPLQ